MKKKLLLTFVIMAFNFAQSQNGKIDSLKTQIAHAKDDIKKTQLYNALAEEFKTINPNLMIEYALKAAKLSKEIGNNLEKGYAFINLGTANIILGDYSKSLHYFSKAKYVLEDEINKSFNKSEVPINGLAKIYASIGIVFSEQSNYASALEYYFKAEKLYSKLKNEPMCAKVYNNIGVVYKSQHQEFKALEYFIKSEKLQRKWDVKNLGITYTNIGTCYLNQKNYPSALLYLNKAKQYLYIYPNKRALGEWYNNLGLYYQAINNSSKTIESWKNALKSFESINDKFGSADTYLYLAEFHTNLKNYDQAQTFAEKSLQLSQETSVLEQTILAEELLIAIFKMQQNIEKSYLHLLKLNIAKDSLNKRESVRKSDMLVLTYDFEKKEVLHQLALEKKEILLKEQSKSSKLVLIFMLILTLLLVGIGFLIYKRIELKKNLTLQKEMAEYEQKALHLQMNPHFVFNCLGSISSFIVQNGTESAIKYLSKFSKLMRLTLEYSKESHIPIDKEIESLQNYLELEQLRFNQKFNFNISKSPDIEDDMVLPPLLLQPFVENAIIHGVIPRNGQGNIYIRFCIENNSLQCIVEDNGIGISNSQKIKSNTVVVHKSMALDILTKRMEMISSLTNQKANYSIEELTENTIINGTRVTLNLPIQFINQKLKK